MYTPVTVQKTLDIRQLYSVHYFEYTSDYRFHGEAHDFWELLYVDRGCLRVIAGEEEHDLSRGQIIFHAPGEFHALCATGVAAPNLVVTGFSCDSPAMDFFRKRITFAGAVERELLARIVEEGRAAFSTPQNDPMTRTLERAADAPVGAEQLLTAALEELLLLLMRQGERQPVRQRQLSRPDGALAPVTAYLEQSLDRPLTVEQICRDNMIGRSQLQKLFHQQTGGGVMDYFNHMKIDAARRMIREGHLNFSQISDRLGFQSVNYFSRRFKELTGMSPTEYAESVKILMEMPAPLADN